MPTLWQSEHRLSPGRHLHERGRRRRVRAGRPRRQRRRHQRRYIRVGMAPRPRPTVAQHPPAGAGQHIIQHRLGPVAIDRPPPGRRGRRTPRHLPRPGRNMSTPASSKRSAIVPAARLSATITPNGWARRHARTSSAATPPPAGSRRPRPPSPRPACAPAPCTRCRGRRPVERQRHRLSRRVEVGQSRRRVEVDRRAELAPRGQTSMIDRSNAGRSSRSTRPPPPPR